MQKFEKLKFKYQFYKDRVLFFSAMFAGSFAGINSENKFIFIASIIGIIYSTIGVAKNLYKAGNLIKELDND
jgi:prepilin signal peptidase PulO-like enzyme (type II secretory pathway)